MKKTLFRFLLVLCLALSLAAFAGCFGNNTKNYVGSYESVWLDSQNEAGNVSFKLSITSDNIALLERLKGYDTVWSVGGTWAGQKAKDGGILCLMNSRSAARPQDKAYFTLEQLSDGRFAAHSSITYWFYTVDGLDMDLLQAYPGFGYSGDYRGSAITLIIFEKK